jgi:hypothetical protein
MEDKHIMDASKVASLQEGDVLNDIARWNKIFVKWGSIRYHHQSQVTRHGKLNINLYLFLSMFDNF